MPMAQSQGPLLLPPPRPDVYAPGRPSKPTWDPPATDSHQILGFWYSYASSAVRQPVLSSSPVMAEVSRRYTFVIEKPDLKSSPALSSPFVDRFRSPSVKIDGHFPQPEPAVNLSNYPSPSLANMADIRNCVQAKRPPNSFLIFVCQFKDVISRMLREKRMEAGLGPPGDANLSRKLLSIVWRNLQQQPRTERIRAHYKRLAKELDTIHRHCLPEYRHKVQKMVPEDCYRKYEVELHRVLSTPPSVEMSNTVIVRISKRIDLHIHEVIHGPAGSEGLGSMDDEGNMFVSEDVEDETQHGRESSVGDSTKHQRSQSPDNQTNRKHVNDAPAVYVDMESGHPLIHPTVDRVRFSPISADSSPEYESLKWIPVVPPVSTTPATPYLTHELLQTNMSEQSTMTTNASNADPFVNFTICHQHQMANVMPNTGDGSMVDFSAQSHPNFTLFQSSVLNGTHFPVSAPASQSSFVPSVTGNDNSQRWDWDISAIPFHLPTEDVRTSVSFPFAPDTQQQQYNPFQFEIPPPPAAHMTDDFLPFPIDGVNVNAFAAQNQGFGGVPGWNSNAIWLPPHGLPKTKTSTFYTLNPLTGDVSAWLVCETEVE
ncbi:hypothetical protein BJ742DRAFT_875222 [Cladochytrium replicatum]|nr:hypothetical protein BJ742DRAFT_875222 [Cladochytrium replicatum]